MRAAAQMSQRKRWEEGGEIHILKFIEYVQSFNVPLASQGNVRRNFGARWSKNVERAGREKYEIKSNVKQNRSTVGVWIEHS